MAAASGESGSRFVSDAVPIYAMVDSAGLFFSFSRLWNAFLNSAVSRSFDVTRIRPEKLLPNLTYGSLTRGNDQNSPETVESDILTCAVVLGCWARAELAVEKGARNEVIPEPKL